MATYPLRVMLVEDDEIDAEKIKRAFRALAFPPHLTVYQTASEALAALHSPHPMQPCYPTLVLLDLNLPGMSGLEFLQQVRQDAQLRELVVFVLTDSHNDADRAAAYDLAIAGYLHKSGLGRSCENLVDLVDVYMQTMTIPAL